MDNNSPSSLISEDQVRAQAIAKLEVVFHSSTPISQALRRLVEHDEKLSKEDFDKFQSANSHKKREFVKIIIDQMIHHQVAREIFPTENLMEVICNFVGDPVVSSKILTARAILVDNSPNAKLLFAIESTKVVLLSFARDTDIETRRQAAEGLADITDSIQWKQLFADTDTENALVSLAVDLVNCSKDDCEQHEKIDMAIVKSIRNIVDSGNGKHLFISDKSKRAILQLARRGNVSIKRIVAEAIAIISRSPRGRFAFADEETKSVLELVLNNYPLDAKVVAIEAIATIATSTKGRKLYGDEMTKSLLCDAAEKSAVKWRRLHTQFEAQKIIAKAIANITHVHEAQVIFADDDIKHHLIAMIAINDQAITQLAVCAIGNITTSQQGQSVFAKTDVQKVLFAIAATFGDDIKAEAARAIANLAGCLVGQRWFIDANSKAFLLELANTTNNDVKMQVARTIRNIATSVEAHRIFADIDILINTLLRLAATGNDAVKVQVVDCIARIAKTSQGSNSFLNSTIIDWLLKLPQSCKHESRREMVRSIVSIYVYSLNRQRDNLTNNSNKNSNSQTIIEDDWLVSSITGNYKLLEEQTMRIEALITSETCKENEIVALNTYLRAKDEELRQYLRLVASLNADITAQNEELARQREVIVTRDELLGAQKEQVGNLMATLSARDIEIQRQNESFAQRIQQLELLHTEQLQRQREDMEREAHARIVELESANAKMLQRLIETDNACPFQRYQGHLLRPDILPLGAEPGLYDADQHSLLFQFCQSLCDIGGMCVNGIRQPITGFRLVAVQAVSHRQSRIASYVDRYAALSERRKTGSDRFNVETAAMSQEQKDVLSALRERFLERHPDAGDRSINSIYSFHGTRPNSVDLITGTGLASLRSTDPGFVGGGCYTTLDIEYAARYASGEFSPAYDGSNDRFPVIMLACLVGMAYPITPGLDYLRQRTVDGNRVSDYFDTTLKTGFDCHVVCVSSVTGYQSVNRAESEYVEIVMDQEAQMLPVAVLWFERT